MAPTPQKPDKLVIKRDGFTIRDGIITYNGHARVDGPRLEAMFHPERLKAHRLQKAAENEAKRLFSRPFFAAQLRWHGITFPKTATEERLKSLLDKAAAAKQCVKVPASIIQLHEELRRDYDREAQAWEHTIANWDAEVERRQEDDWARLKTPSERAGYDLDRFMEHYFLTNGQPDPAKKPEPVALYGFSDDQVISELQVRATGVPDLECAVGGEGPDRTLCIGWDRASVCGLASEIQDIALQRQRQKNKDDWEMAMQSHRDYIAQCQAQARVQSGAAGPVRAAQKVTTLQSCRGSYVVKCQAISEMFPDNANIFTVNVGDSPTQKGDTVLAGVDFGVFQGTAILAFNGAVLDWFTRYYDKKAIAATGKNPGNASLLKSNGKRKADHEEAEGGPSAKQRKLDGPHPEGRIMAQMRGRNAMIGQICPDILSGYLDFTDNDCTTFKGVFDIPGVGEDVEVEGFRVARFAAMEPPPWDWFWPGIQHM